MISSDTLNRIVSQRNTQIETQSNWYGAAGEIFDVFMLPNVVNLFRKPFLYARKLNRNITQRFSHPRKTQKLIFGVVTGFGVWISDFQTTMPPCHVESSRSEPHPYYKKLM